jgi:hypothetical protein
MSVLLYDSRDLVFAEKLRDKRFQWLQEMGASELGELAFHVRGFLFGYEQGQEKLNEQVGNRPNVHDRPEEREELRCLDQVLFRLAQASVDVPTPRTWVIEMDRDMPSDLQFPLFLRTPTSSWKRGGYQGRVRNVNELVEEVELLRRAFGWNVSILAREWIDFAVAGEWMYGKVPQEIRVWIVAQMPVAWSFHYTHVVKGPKGFPPKNKDLEQLRELARRVASPFRSRLIAADFACDRRGQWHLVEAGAGACSGTGHEAVFKFVARRLVSTDAILQHGDKVGGSLLSHSVTKSEEPSAAIRPVISILPLWHDRNGRHFGMTGEDKIPGEAVRRR